MAERKIKVLVVPITGDPVTHEIVLSGRRKATVERSLEQAGVSRQAKSITIARQVAVTVDLNTVVEDGETITVTELPQGS